MVFREHRLRALLLSIFVHLGFYVTRIVQQAQRLDHDAPKSPNSSKIVNKMNTSFIVTSAITPSTKGIFIVRKQR
jgi:transcriptional regulatory protein LevR